MNKSNNSVVFKHEPLWFTQAIVKFYCRRLHSSGTTCLSCHDILAFEEERVRACIQKRLIMSCQTCDRKCYPDAKRLEINHIMRWAKPKFYWRHPLLTLRYFFQKIIK